jgi:hypothetical protein
MSRSLTMKNALARQAARIHYHVYLAFKSAVPPYSVFDLQRVPCKNWRDVHWSFRFARKYGYTVARISKHPLDYPINPSR